jgi:hypothetical protein
MTPIHSPAIRAYAVAALLIANVALWTSLYRYLGF